MNEIVPSLLVPPVQMKGTPPSKCSECGFLYIYDGDTEHDCVHRLRRDRIDLVIELKRMCDTANQAIANLDVKEYSDIICLLSDSVEQGMATLEELQLTDIEHEIHLQIS